MSKDDFVSPSPEVDAPIGEYHDGQIMAYATMVIERELGGFALGSSHLLANRQGGVLTALGNPVNVGGEDLRIGDVAATSIRYAFDKHSRPDDGAISLGLREVLEGDLDDVTLMQRVRDADLISVRELERGTADETRQALLDRLAVIQAVTQHDMFDEIIPSMGHNDQARIIFPYNTMGARHWVTGEINIIRTLDPGTGQYRYDIDMTSHDPFGRGSGIAGNDAREIAEAIYRRVMEEHNRLFPLAQVGGQNFRFRNVDSPYEALQRQMDGVSCGIITAHEMTMRLSNQAIENVQYVDNAIELRMAQLHRMRAEYGDNSQIYRSFIQGYADGSEKGSSKKELEDLTGNVGLGLSDKEIEESAKLERFYEFIRAAEQRYSGNRPSLSSKKDVISSSTVSYEDIPLFQRRLKEITAVDDKAIKENIEKVEVRVPNPDWKKGRKKIPKTITKDGFRHIADPTETPFPTEEECIANARAHMKEWETQLLRIRDISARALEEASMHRPGSIGQPENTRNARAIQELATLLHNRVEAERIGREWGVVDESGAVNNKGFAPLTTNPSVIRFGERDVRIISAENGKDSSMSSFRRRGLALGGIEQVDLRQREIGPWRWNNPENAHKVEGRDPEENSPFLGRIPIVSNISSGRGDTRHAEANTLGFLFNMADYMIREERAGGNYTEKDDRFWDPIAVEDVKDRVRNMLLDTATDKPHCAECGHANEQVFGSEFNSGTPREARIFEHWGEPFPGFYELYGENPFRSVDRQLREPYRPGLMTGMTEVAPFRISDLHDFNSEINPPHSPGQFYENQLVLSETRMVEEPVRKKRELSPTRYEEFPSFNFANEMGVSHLRSPSGEGPEKKARTPTTPRLPVVELSKEDEEALRSASMSFHRLGASPLSSVISNPSHSGTSPMKEEEDKNRRK